MVLSPEVQASLIKVSSDWAMFLANYEPKKRKAVLIRLLKRYDAIYQILQEKAGK